MLAHLFVEPLLEVLLKNLPLALLLDLLLYHHLLHGLLSPLLPLRIRRREPHCPLPPRTLHGLGGLDEGAVLPDPPLLVQLLALGMGVEE